MDGKASRTNVHLPSPPTDRNIHLDIRAAVETVEVPLQLVRPDVLDGRHRPRDADGVQVPPPLDPRGEPAEAEVPGLAEQGVVEGEVEGLGRGVEEEGEAAAAQVLQDVLEQDRVGVDEVPVPDGGAAGHDAVGERAAERGELELADLQVHLDRDGLFAVHCVVISGNVVTMLCDKL